MIPTKDWENWRRTMQVEPDLPEMAAGVGGAGRSSVKRSAAHDQRLVPCATKLTVDAMTLHLSRDSAAVGSEWPGFGSWPGQFQGHFPALSCYRGNVVPRLSPRTTVRRVNRRDDDAPGLPDATQGVRHPEGHQIVIRRVLPGATPAHHGQIVAQAVH